ncbi:nuclear transport factor 2 family protein [Zunongwangia sp. F363]|uniref:Nuclear transport factor 2 family protein n=1 Tax=Autumnicola tepida TaxID=3075595 RepID=A0ABU3CES9_9FLAO|nr:nuclear transport factor 2 family protein [Zunongwangia sp. F363]MDT0644859.1 nuclear transport factor 2 family protein [Zunongwangia sp. F363]
MKINLTMLALFFFGISFAQEPENENTSAEFEIEGSSEADAKDAAVKLVEDFFVAFHKKDTTAMREFAHPDIVMRSVAVDTAGSNTVTTESYSEFLKSIGSIPTSTKFEERLHSFAVHASGELASVLTPYSVYVDDQLKHCGVNSFQLVKVGEEWKILYLVDTRKTEGCETFEARERAGGETKKVLDKAPDFDDK